MNTGAFFWLIVLLLAGNGVVYLIESRIQRRERAACAQEKRP